MTCIATDGKTMAGDGRVTTGQTVLADDFVKVRHLPDGSVVGLAGAVTDIVLAFDWLERGAPFDVIPKWTDKDGVEGLILHHDGRLLWFDQSCVMVPYSPPWAIGAGAEVALTCLDIGRTPVEAVARSYHRNSHCGGLITVCQPFTPAPTRKRRLWPRLQR